MVPSSASGTPLERRTRGTLDLDRLVRVGADIVVVDLGPKIVFDVTGPLFRAAAGDGHRRRLRSRVAAGRRGDRDVGLGSNTVIVAVLPLVAVIFAAASLVDVHTYSADGSLIVWLDASCSSAVNVSVPPGASAALPVTTT